MQDGANSYGSNGIFHYYRHHNYRNYYEFRLQQNTRLNYTWTLAPYFHLFKHDRFIYADSRVYDTFITPDLSTVKDWPFVIADRATFLNLAAYPHQTLQNPAAVSTSTAVAAVLSCGSLVFGTKVKQVILRSEIYCDMFTQLTRKLFSQRGTQ